MRIIQALLTVFVGCLLLAAAYLSNLISQGHFALEQAARYNIVWAINQSLVEMTRLEQKIAEYAINTGPAERDEVKLRYQILLGRADMLRRGQSADFMRQNAEYLQILDDLEVALEAAEPVIGRLGEPGSVQELDAILSPLDKKLARLASASRQFGDELNAQDQARLRHLHFLYTGVASGLILCGIGLILLLTWNNRLLGRAHRELRTLADELGSVSDALKIQNERFEAALKNMSLGLCMADGAGHLVVSNERFRQIFNLPENISPNMDPKDLITDAGDPDSALALHQLYARRSMIGSGGRSSSFVQERPDGRAFSIQHVALADGGWLATVEDITDRRRAEFQIVRMAHHDSLTDLANRVLFHERLRAALSEAARTKLTLAILFIDLDGFKDVNDTLGHQVGDEVLKAVADRLRSCARSGDLIARLGGDEFGLLIPPSHEDVDYGAIASRLIDTIGRPYFVDGNEVVIGVSIGIATSKGGDCGPEELLRHADLALYDVKAAGRRGFRFFEQRLDELLQERKRMEADLRKALEGGEIEVFYQPAVGTKDGGVKGFEALARWRHPEHGMVPPTVFISIAEDTGMIGSIGEWVLRQACTEASTWPPGIILAVNISAYQFRDEDLAQKILVILDECGLPAERLELEITETVVLEQSYSNLSVLHALREKGVRIAMDDFGTGYSSLRYILGFPFDKIKIDRSFVENVLEDKGSAAIVQLIADLGTHLGIATAAEGVETEEQYKYISSTGCAEMQGFYFAEPMPASQIHSYIKARGAHPRREMRPSKRTAARPLLSPIKAIR